MSEVLPPRLRIVVVTFVLPGAAFFAFLGCGALSNLWADYKDSSDTTYLLVGGVSLFVPATLAGVIWYTLRGANLTLELVSIGSGLVLSLAAGIALVVLASGPLDFRESGASVSGTPPATPLATPSIATPSQGR
jgi:hypothetical protein